MSTIAFRILKNSTALVLATGMERVVTFFLTLYIARSLGRSSLGEYSLAISFMAIFATISSFGQHVIVPREVARHRPQAFIYLLNSSAISLVASLPSAVMMIVAAHLLNYPDRVTGYIYVIGFVLFPETLVAIGEAAIQGLERLEYVTLVRFLTSTFRVACSLAVLHWGYGLGAVFVVWGISQTIAFAAYIWLISRTTSAPRFHLNPSLLKNLVQSSLIFLVVSINATLFKRIDVVMLSKIGGVDAVGTYAAAGKLVLTIETMAPAFLLSVFPVMSAAFVVSKEKFEKICTESLKLVTVVIVPIVFALCVAGRIVPMLFGKEFSDSVPVFQVLIWMLVPGLTSSMLFRAILASDNEKISLLFGAVKAVVNVSLNFLLIPGYGALGASIAAVATQSVALIQVYWFTSKRLFKIKFMEIFGKPGLCALLSGGIFFYIWRANFYILLPFTLLVYLALLVASGVLSHRELLLLRQLWRVTTGAQSATLE
jgi:O-antigen/teichoic acid export membrane protein